VEVRERPVLDSSRQARAAQWDVNIDDGRGKVGCAVTHASISLIVLGLVVVAFVVNRWPVEVVAIGSALLLLATGVIGIDEAVAGFGDPTVILIAALFVVSEGLDATGVTTWIGRWLAARAGGSRPRLLVLVMVLAAGLTALINLNGSVAALLPMLVVVAVQRGIPASKLLMPLAFAGSAGSMLLLTGSPVNVIVADAAAEAGVGAFRFAEFAIVGIPLVAGVILVVLAFGDRLLPDRSSATQLRDLSAHADTLVRQYSLQNVVHLQVGHSSTMVGRPRDRWDLAGYPGIRVVTVVDDAQRPVSDGHLVAGDRLTVVGDPEVAAEFGADHGLAVESIRGRDAVTRALIGRTTGVAEVVVPPRSRLTGETVATGRVVPGGNLVVLAVQRQGHDRGREPTVLRAGDALLVEGPWEALDALIDLADVLVVDSPELVRRQGVPLGAGSTRAIAVLAAMVVMLATGIVPAVVAALLAAGAMIVLRVLTVEQAYRRISWTTVLLIAGIIPLSTAIRSSGAGQQIAELIVGAVRDAGGLALLIALFLLTVVFGQMISNTATALIVIPIAVSAAVQLDVSPKPVLMCVGIAAAASFLTPVATPANMMVMKPAGYRFGDYWRLGLPMVGVFFVVAIGLVPLVWPL
jgi:di/tricarboxylate transporter